jgi:hypothetical protein
MLILFFSLFISTFAEYRPAHHTHLTSHVAPLETLPSHSMFNLQRGKDTWHKRLHIIVALGLRSSLATGELKLEIPELNLIDGAVYNENRLWAKTVWTNCTETQRQNSDCCSATEIDDTNIYEIYCENLYDHLDKPGAEIHFVPSKIEVKLIDNTKKDYVSEEINLCNVDEDWVQIINIDTNSDYPKCSATECPEGETKKGENQCTTAPLEIYTYMFVPTDIEDPTTCTKECVKYYGGSEYDNDAIDGWAVNIEGEDSGWTILDKNSAICGKLEKFDGSTKVNQVSLTNRAPYLATCMFCAGSACGDGLWDCGEYPAVRPQTADECSAFAANTVDIQQKIDSDDTPRWAGVVDSQDLPVGCFYYPLGGIGHLKQGKVYFNKATSSGRECGANVRADIGKTEIGTNQDGTPEYLTEGGVFVYETTNTTLNCVCGNTGQPERNECDPASVGIQTDSTTCTNNGMWNCGTNDPDSDGVKAPRVPDVGACERFALMNTGDHVEWGNLYDQEGVPTRWNNIVNNADLPPGCIYNTVSNEVQWNLKSDSTTTCDDTTFSNNNGDCLCGAPEKFISDYWTCRDGTTPEKLLTIDECKEFAAEPHPTEGDLYFGGAGAWSQSPPGCYYYDKDDPNYPRMVIFNERTTVYRTAADKIGTSSWASPLTHSECGNKLNPSNSDGTSYYKATQKCVCKKD